MNSPNNIIDCLKRNASKAPNEVAYEFITEITSDTEKLTYKGLYEEATTAAFNLMSRVSPGDCVLLLYPPGLDYIKVFFACIMAGVVAVPLFPPKRNNKSDKIFKVAASSNAKVALVTEQDLGVIKELWAGNGGNEMEFISTPQLINEVTKPLVDLPATDPGAPAFLQYTSGSTGDPKGVIITQGNIFANTRYLETLSGANEKDVFVNWLPQFHDLGLVTTILLPAFLKCRSVLMAPATFVRNPAVWLLAITKFKGTIAGAPNFAFDLCVDKISNDDMNSIDLTSLRITYNAAEPVKICTLNRFAKRFSLVGFDRNSFYPAYGMAESTAFITGGHGSDLLNSICIDKNALAQNKIKLVNSELADSTANSLDYIGNGFTDEEHKLHIVNPETYEIMQEGEIGEIWFSGPSVSPGYWLEEEASAKAFKNRIVPDDGAFYLNTGDLGFVIDRQLYVTGRSKDMMILNGKNYYPQDIESTVKYCHEDLHPGYCAAFEVEGQLVVVAEINRQALKHFQPHQIEQSIARTIYLEHDISPSNIVLLAPYKIPMTSSGKIRRRQTKLLFQNGKLVSLHQKGNSQPVIQPSGEIENIVHDIWKKALGEQNVCVQRGFFELGGNSIKAIEIVTSIRKQFHDVHLDEAQVYECVNIKEMAQLISIALTKSKNSENTVGAIRI